MKTYQFFVDDDRYQVPTLVLCEATTDGHAQASAREVLLRSSHHHQVEIYAGEKFLAVVRRPRSPAVSTGCDQGPRLA